MNASIRLLILLSAYLASHYVTADEILPLPGSVEPDLAFASSTAFSITTPLREGRVFRGELDIQVNADGSGLMVDKSQLVGLLSGRLSINTRERLLLLSTTDNYISALQSADAGVTLEFDSSSVEVVATVEAESRQSISLYDADSRQSAPDRIGVEPVGVSAHLNVEGFVVADDLDGSYGSAGPNLNLDGALHIAPLAHVTLEGSLGIDEDGDSRRGELRAVLVDENARWAARAGDVGLNGIGYMSNTSILGIELTNRSQFSSRLGSVRTVGQRSFFLDTPAIARVFVNGVESRVFDLDPGPYDVSDFPLANGANDVVFVIEDESGEIDRIEFNVFADLSLLAPGTFEYGVSAGVTSESGGQTFSYDGESVGSGFVEFGVLQNLSAGLGVQMTSERSRLIAGSIRTSNKLGRFGVRTAYSSHEKGSSGAAAAANWNYLFEGVATARKPSIGVGIEYQASDFEALFDQGGVNVNRSRYNARWNQPIGKSWSVGLGAGYLDNRNSPDDRTAILSIGNTIGHWSLSSQFSYEDAGQDGKDEWNARISVRADLGNNSRFFSEIETRDSTALVGYARSSENSGVGAWAYGVDLRSVESDVVVTGDGQYQGNRFVVSATQNAEINRLDSEATSGLRTSLRFGTAIAFADGKTAIGRPVQDSFAIFYPHPSLQHLKILAGTDNRSNDYLATSGLLGPALIPRVNSFGTQSLSYDVENLPLDYDLGAGVAIISPRYRSGVTVQVGSGITVTVIGTLLDDIGDQLSVTVGVARSLDNPETEEIDVFTNRSGRFGLQGIRPGRWELKVDSKSTLTYLLEVPVDASGILRVGKLAPIEGDL